MDRWSDELVHRVIRDPKIRDSFIMVEKSTSGEQPRLSMDISYQHRPVDTGRRKPVQDFITPHGPRSPDFQESSDILSGISETSTYVGKILESDNRLWIYHVMTIWYAKNYTPERKKRAPHANNVLDWVAEELRTRIGVLYQDLTDEEVEIPVKRIAAAVVGELEKNSFMASDVSVDDMRNALIAVARDEDLAVSYEATVALAKMARRFYGREGMISKSLRILFETLKRAASDSIYKGGPVINLIRQFDMLTAHPEKYSRFTTVLNSFSVEVLKGLHVLDELMEYGATYDVRKEAAKARKALGTRMRNFMEKGPFGGSDAGGSPTPQMPPPLPPSTPTPFHSAAAYIGTPLSLR